jgi:hypothetical protein
VGLTTVTTAAQILIDKDVILDGEHKLTVDGGRSTRVFSVPADVTVELRRLAVSGGNGGHYGGGILNFGTATLVNCTVSGNTATSAGGGISNGDPQNNGLLTITTSTVSGNIVESGGGGGIANWGTATVMDSEVSENTANTAGGFGNAGVATVTNSTISRNITAYRGGGIGHQEGALTLIASTVSGNEAGDVGGAI